MGTVNTYEWAPLRVVPRVDRGECVNVGVLLYCRHAVVLTMRLALDVERLSTLFPSLDVDEVAVAGTRHLDPATIREAAGIDVGRPLLLADLDGARDALEAMPWVESARFTRDLPGTVEVRVREREAVAVVAAGDRAVLVDRDGRVLEEATATTGAGQVQVVATEAPPAPGRAVPADLRTAIDLAGRLRANPLGAVAAVRTAPTLRLDLVDGGTVELGDASELDAKVEAFRTVHARVDRTCLDTLDLTVPTHPVLTRKPC